VVNSVLLRPLAFRQPQRLCLIREIVPQITKFYPSLPANLPNFRIWQKQVQSFDQIAIAKGASMDFTGHGQAVQIPGAIASANLFDTLGVNVALGRNFRAEEDQPGHDHVIILTDSFWRSEFNADPSIVGKAITLNGAPCEIIGVLPASFHFPHNDQLGPLTSFSPHIDFFKPLGLDPTKFSPLGEFDYAAIARLKLGVSVSQALAEINVVQARIAKDAKQGVDLRAELIPLNVQVVGSAREGLFLLLAAVGAVLLIVCVNIANLLLARIPGRMREAAIRTALGATRARLVRQMLTESLLLGAFGGALGMALANFGVQAIVQAAPPGIPRLDEVAMDSRVVWFAIVISVFTAVLFGILPAWRVAHVAPQEALKSGSTSATESRRTRSLRSSLIGLEVGLSTILLIFAGLLTSSLVHLVNVNVGFQAENILATDIQLPPRTYYQPVARQNFYDTAVAGIRAIPGVVSAAWVSLLPLEGQNNVSQIWLPGAQQLSAATPLANFRVVSPGYFNTMSIPLIAGRDFTEADRHRRVLIVSQSLAQRFWPGRNPVGQTCIVGWSGHQRNEVIGVAGDIHAAGLDQPPMIIVYVPDEFASGNPGATPSASIVIRTATKPAGAATAVRNVIRNIDPDVPITALRPMSKVVAQSVDTRRFQMFLALLFAACALCLAALGIFGVVAYSVEQRHHELGIRLALGAQIADLCKMVLRQGMIPVAAGLVAGIAVSLLLGRLIASLLFGVGALDLLTFGCVAFVVLAVALAACYIPARRAMRVDPMVALRHE